MPAEATFGILFFKRQWRLFGIMFQSIKSTSSIMFIFLIILSLAFQAIVYEVGLIPSMYFEVLGAKDYGAFKNITVYSMEIIILNALMKSANTYLSRLLYVKWREMLCRFFHSKYFIQNDYYKLNVLNPKLDNIDQRIVRDITVSCQVWSQLMPILVVIPFTIIYYSYQCFISTTYLGPVIIYAYFIGGTIINSFLMGPVVRTTVLREKREGDFRFQHLQVRVNAESMAFYQAEEIEKYKCNSRLNILLNVLRTLYRWCFLLNSSVCIFDYAGNILGYLIIAIPIFGGHFDDLAPEELSALISRNAFVCIYLIHSFTQLFDMSKKMTNIAGHTHRLGELIEYFENDDKPERVIRNETVYDSITDCHNDYDGGEFSDEEKDQLTELDGKPSREDLCFELKNVTCIPPDGSNELLRSLNLVLSAGQNVLITGCGKTSLLRILHNLWAPIEGSVKRFCEVGRGGVMFLPQKSVFTDGTLKQMVTYPSMDGYIGYSLSTDHERIMNILDEVGLTDFSNRMNGKVEVNWADKISPGEMQRLSFARLFYHQPKLAILDEPTSALNAEMTDHLFQLCKKKDITLVTAAHNSALMKVLIVMTPCRAKREKNEEFRRPSGIAIKLQSNRLMTGIALRVTLICSCVVILGIKCGSIVSQLNFTIAFPMGQWQCDSLFMTSYLTLNFILFYLKKIFLA